MVNSLIIVIFVDVSGNHNYDQSRRRGVPLSSPHRRLQSSHPPTCFSWFTKGILVWAKTKFLLLVLRFWFYFSNFRRFIDLFSIFEVGLGKIRMRRAHSEWLKWNCLANGRLIALSTLAVRKCLCRLVACHGTPIISRLERIISPPATKKECWWGIHVTTSLSMNSYPYSKISLVKQKPPMGACGFMVIQGMSGTITL